MSHLKRTIRIGEVYFICVDISGKRQLHRYSLKPRDKIPATVLRISSGDTTSHFETYKFNLRRTNEKREAKRNSWSFRIYSLCN